MEMWDQVIKRLEAGLGKETVEKWIRPLRVERFDAANIFLEAKNSFEIAWFEEHARPILKGLVNQNGRPVKIQISTNEAVAKLHGSEKPMILSHIERPSRAWPYSSDGSLPKRAGEEEVSRGGSKGRFCASKSFAIDSNEEKKAGARQAGQLPYSTEPDPLDPEMTLPHFLYGLPGNKVAYKLVEQAAAKPTFNPVLFYGPKGSGKTHLLMSAAALMKERGLKPFYVRASTFTEHVVQGFRNGNMQAVRKAYRSASALLVDGIDTFAKKTATQEEFFHTFNELHTRGCPIFLSSETPPAKMAEIEPRLVSRFEWGISIGLEKEAPVSILELKCRLWNLAAEPSLLPFLAERFPASPLLALQALALRAKDVSRIGPNLAEALLKDLLEKERKDAITPERIVKALAAHFGIRDADILGKSQTREAALPRQIAMYLCRHRLKLPFQKIGEIFGRDHSTVMASVKQVQEASQKPDLAQTLSEIDTALANPL